MGSNLASLRERKIVQPKYRLASNKTRKLYKKNVRVNGSLPDPPVFNFIPVLLNVMAFLLLTTILAVGLCIAINSKLMGITICQNLRRMMAKNVVVSKKVGNCL